MLGILIGDGQLSYRPEKILEAYYAYSLNKWATVTLDYQFVGDLLTTPFAGQFRFLPHAFMRNSERQMLNGRTVWLNRLVLRARSIRRAVAIGSKDKTAPYGELMG